MEELVFVCSPYRSDDPQEKAHNIEIAKAICKIVAGNGDIPYAPHLLCPQFLDDEDANERITGINIGLQMLTKCDYLLVVGERVSEGMRNEIEYASRRGIEIRWYVD